MGQENIVRYWHSVELLQPQSAPKIKKRSNSHSPFFHDTPILHPIPPWSPESVVAKQALPKGRVWSHTLYAHLYDSRLVAEKLKEAYGADQGYREPQHRESALFAAKFNMDGHMVEKSFVLSSEAWFLGRVLTGKDWTRGFENDQEFASNQAKAILHSCVTADALRELTQWILNFSGLSDFFGDMDRHQFRFRSQPVKSNKPEQEDDPLNSFLLNDLADVAKSISLGVKSVPLDQYLSQHDPLLRLHLDDDSASLPQIERLMPDAYPNSCWPTERHLGLVHSQQLAVNTILSTLAKGNGLLGINGPPGTGKTTLLRDLIAAIVTNRADELAKLPRASDGFIKNGREEANDSGKPQSCFKLNSALYGFEIVVASFNNGAVENVTLELPQREKIDESWLPEAEYFSDLGELTSGKAAWGLISGALGSKARRKKFVDCYFYGKKPFSSNGKTGSENGDDEADEEIEKALNMQPSGLFTEDGSNESGGNIDVDNLSPERTNSPQGLMDWLKERVEINATRSPEERQALWRQAVCEYEAVKKAARQACADAVRISELIPSICQTRNQIAENSKAINACEQDIANAEAQLAHLDSEDSRLANLELKQCLGALKQHQTLKPGFWANLFSLWKLQRDWNTTMKLLEGERDLATAEVARIERLTKQVILSRDSLQNLNSRARQQLQKLRDHEKVLTRDAISLANASKADHLVTWLQGGSIGRGDSIELAEPWSIKGWRQARARVFIQALKLHRTFFELEASRMRSNLFLINSILTGSRFQGLSSDAIRSVWASLFMVVPVLSSTFASFARSFGSLGASEIGWLLVDEAGQAPPQAAVGALWRSRRALLVGDPLQLKPIVTVSDAVLEHMRTCYQVDPHWLPNRESAQTLADAATTWGRMAGPAGIKTWVGLPLAVHRRCDRPMHSLANRIAYDGTMVYGTIEPGPEKETPASLSTGWIHASGTSQGNWVPAEGNALQQLLDLLHDDGVEPKDISIITPFTDVRNNLKRIVGNKFLFGTIHTMQGKEAPIVILVLGGNTAGSGARNWAVSEPNLLNVAATRAKRRLYVIGDRSDWMNRSLFCNVMELLPLQTIPTRYQI